MSRAALLVGAVLAAILALGLVLPQWAIFILTIALATGLVALGLVLLLRAGRTVAEGPREEVLTAENLERAFGVRFDGRGPAFSLRSEVLPGGSLAP